jgi:hypothetical protein
LSGSKRKRKFRDLGATRSLILNDALEL